MQGQKRTLNDNSANGKLINNILISIIKKRFGLFAWSSNALGSSAQRIVVRLHKI